MSKIFVSSVIEGFEKYRESAKKAIQLMQYHPVMAEDFPSTPYSPEEACLTKVRESDAFVLILGKSYGSKNANDISATHAEYLEAKKANKPIFAFIQEISMDAEQTKFKKEVEQYEGGLLRTKFSKPEELKDGIVSALANFKITHTPLKNEKSEKEFKARLKKIAPNFYDNNHNVSSIIAFWGQPAQEVDLDKIEKGLDSTFAKLCEIEGTSLSRGYERISEKDHVAIKTNSSILAYFEDSLTFFYFKSNCHDNNEMSFAYNYISPERFRSITQKAIMLNTFSNAWVSVGIFGLDHCYFSNPTKYNSMTYPMRSEHEKLYYKFFSSITEKEYIDWLETRIQRFKREFGEKQPSDNQLYL